jgi:hypothetical protein
MSGHDDAAAATDQGTQPAEEASLLSRRSALRTAGVAGIAATALAAGSMPALASARPARAGRDGTDEHGAHPAEPVVAHVRNARTGEIDVFRGTSQVRLHDPALAALLVRASR